jgi:hypothetical protein
LVDSFGGNRICFFSSDLSGSDFGYSSIRDDGLSIVYKCRGRFDVFDDNSDLESPGWHGSPKDTLKTTTEEQDQPLKQQEREERDHRKTEERELRENSREQRRNEDRDRGDRSDRVDDAFLASSGSLMPDRALLPSARGGREEDRERDR